MIAQPITRRTALKFSSAAAFATATRSGPARAAFPQAARGYGTDPNLMQRHVPWPRTLNASYIATLAALCDVILPAEFPHPSAATIGVQDFLDEWLSAPYPQMQTDRLLVLRGLTVLDEDTFLKSGVTFASVDRAQQTATFDACCNPYSSNAEFAHRLIQLVCGGYYTTREGLTAIGYVGNVALRSFPGPPDEVVHLLEEALRKF